MGSVQTPDEIVRRHFMARDICATCSGTGEGPIASEQDCTECQGAGFTRRSPDRLAEELKRWFEEMLRRCVDQDEVDPVVHKIDWAELAAACVKLRQ